MGDFYFMASFMTNFMQPCPLNKYNQYTSNIHRHEFCIVTTARLNLSSNKLTHGNRTVQLFTSKLHTILIDYLRTTLHSFVNNYQAVMWRLRECSLNDEQLGIAVGLSGNAIRNRRTKPDLWKLSDVERLATHFTLPVTACIQLQPGA